MDEPGEDGDVMFVAHHEAAEVKQPADGAFDLPAVPVSPELAPVLVCRHLVVAPAWDDRLDPASHQVFARGVAVVRSICNQPIGSFPRATRPVRAADRDAVERFLEEPDFRRGCRVHVNSDRSTRAIGQYHELRSLAPLGFADTEPPFLADTNVPSTKHSSHRIMSRSFSWARKARHRSRSTPVRDHSDNRRQHVVELPYRRGNSLQGAPVHRIQRTPSKHFRSSAQGRPPFAVALRAGTCSRIKSHCRSVNRRHAIPNLPACGLIDRLSTSRKQRWQGL
jgi:hypothetical protein